MEFVWDNLVCDCGSVQFVPVIALRWKPGGGLVPQPTGKHYCVQCREVVDTAKLTDAAHKRLKQKEIEAILSARD